MSAAPPPPTDNSSGPWVDAGAVTDFEPGAGRRVQIGEAHVAVFRAAETTFHALADQCPHAGAPLSAGALRDGVVVCTWHGWRFDPETGRCANVTWSDPVACHDVRVEGGRVLIAPRPRDA